MIVKIQIAILMILLQMLIGCGEYVDVCNDNASKSKRGGEDERNKENNDNKSKKYIETDDVILDYKELKELKNLDASQIKSIGPDNIRRAAHQTYHISPNGKYLYAISKPNIYKNPKKNTWKEYYLLYIYDIKNRKIIDIIENTGIVDWKNQFTSNYDGSIISFITEQVYDFINKKFFNPKLKKLVTYRYNPLFSKYEQNIDAIIGEMPLVPGIDKDGQIIPRIPGTPSPPSPPKQKFNFPVSLFMSHDGKKLIVTYSIGRKISDKWIYKKPHYVYDLIDDKWKMKQLISDAYLGDIKGVSDDFKTILFWGMGYGYFRRSGGKYALIYRLNEENDNYEQIGNSVYSPFDGGLTGEMAIDQTGNRIALSLTVEDMVVIYEYKKQENKWVQIQIISRPEDIISDKTGYIMFGKAIAFADQGKKLLIGTNIPAQPFVNIYNLDKNSGSYKFFQRLTPIKNYAMFGSINPKASQDGKTIVIGSQSVKESLGGIHIFRIKDSDDVVSNVEKPSFEKEKQLKKDMARSNASNYLG